MPGTRLSSLRALSAKDWCLAPASSTADWWLRVSKGTRLAKVAAEVQGRDEGDRRIVAAAATNPELIVVADPERSKLVLLEGHVRLTAYAAFPDYLPPLLEIYLGTSPTIACWSEY